MRARVFLSTTQFDQATADFQAAAALRPHDYMMWLWLGYARTKQQDNEGALAAFSEAARLAPNYAEPHWFLGERLLRVGRRDEAFVELRRAVASNPAMLPDVLGLAWPAFGGDSQQIAQALQPETSALRLALAEFFMTHGQASTIVALCQAPDRLSADDRHTLVAELLRAKLLPEAYQVWRGGPAADAGRAASPGAQINDGSFEAVPDELTEAAPSFDWGLTQGARAARAEPDETDAHSGTHSLRIDWRGDTDPNAPVVSQLVPVAPQQHYRLSFVARTRNVVSGGPVVVTVFDATNDGASLTGQSEPLPPDAAEWRTYTVEFNTGAATNAILIGINRQPCSTNPCPAFGNVWFDDFALQPIP